MSGGGGGGQNTVTSVQQIPEFEQDASRSNQELAQSIGSQPYPVYQGQLIQGFDPRQQQGQTMAVNAANAYQPALAAAGQVTAGALDPRNVNSYAGASGGAINHALGLSDPNAVSQYMNPYIDQALAPQIQQLQLQLGQQQRGIDQQATQAGAFGDARQGAASALQNLYGNQAMNQLVGTGYKDAYSQALQALQGQQGVQLQGAQQYGNLANIFGQEQQTQLQGGAQLGNLAGAQQQLGLTGANAVYNAGQQDQQLGQQELTAAYQQYLNQINWPTQMLNIRESALSNSPYNIASAVTLPQANSAAQGFGGLASIAGLLGGLGSGQANNSPFGGQQIQGARP